MEIWQEEATKALSADGVNTPGPACQHTRTHMPTHQDQHGPYFVSSSFSMEYIQQYRPGLAPPLSLPYGYNYNIHLKICVYVYVYVCVYLVLGAEWKNVQWAGLFNTHTEISRTI